MLILQIATLCCFSVGIGAHVLEDVIHPTNGERQTHTIYNERVPTNVLVETDEETITLYWTPPRSLEEAEFCMVEYKADNNPFITRQPVSESQHIYTIRGLNRNTLFDVRLSCSYGDSGDPSREWLKASTRTVSVEPSVCTGSLPNAFLTPSCVERPERTFCSVTACKPGFVMSNIINVISRLRQKVEPETVYVWCVNGTWLTSYEYESFGIKDICLPEVAFEKCPLSIPNGILEPHCGPATDWLCNFECDDGYHAHMYMSGIFKSFFDDPDMLYCDNGIWKTGYEELGVEVSGVCVTNERNCTDSDDIPHGQVLHLPCRSGYTCGFKCDSGYHKHALAWDDPSCENGIWGLRTTKYDASITPQNVCVRNDTIGIDVCPRNIQNGRIRAPTCTRNCRPECDVGYHVPDFNPWLNLSCEAGRWLTVDAPYNGDNVCFPDGGYICPYEIPNGHMPEKDYRRRDNGESRRYVTVSCSEAYRVHRSMRWLECVAGEWVTGQERFGLDVFALCIPYTP